MYYIVAEPINAISKQYSSI